ncbi:MAG: hypothetical protein U0790_03560 [Isosphaeraceae bacterium]
MDDFSSFVFTSSTTPELPPPAGSLPVAVTPGPARPRGWAVSPEQLAVLGQVAAAVLVVAVLGAAALWDGRGGRPRRERRSPSVEVAHPGAAPTPVALGTGEVGGGPPRPPGRGGTVAASSGLPDLGGAPDPQDDDVRALLVEDGYRERLRREGKLPPEPGTVEDFRRRIEDVKGTLVRSAD